jgi:hypothetical protein
MLALRGHRTAARRLQWIGLESIEEPSTNGSMSMPRAAISVAIGDRAQVRDLVWLPSHLLAMERPVTAKRIEQPGMEATAARGLGQAPQLRLYTSTAFPRADS